MEKTGYWIMGAIMVVVALIGLFMAAKAEDAVFHFGGWIFFAFGVFYVFVMINRLTGHQADESVHEEHGEHQPQH